jgi:tetratricopeptide (TPR) repeat protein
MYHHAKSPEQRGHGLSRSVRYMLWLVAATGFVITALETGLWLFGVQPQSRARDPLETFSSRAPLYVEGRGVTDKEWRTTAPARLEWFNQQDFSDPKDANTFRVFVLGGSTTYGRPYDDATSFAGWLRRFLPVADPTTEWEVINAGGISYASYRVNVVLEEVARYQPDLIILYTGHNEFLERRTYGAVLETSAPVREAQRLSTRLRSVALARSALEAWEGGGGVVDQQPELSGEVNAILDSSVGPSAYHRDDDLRRDVLQQFRYNLHRGIDLARAVGAAIMLITPASNLRHSSPFKSQHTDGLSDNERMRFTTLQAEADSLRRAGEPERALPLLEEALVIDQQYADVHYLHGQVLWDLARYAEARAAFIRARDEDVCPLRALTLLVDAVRAVALERAVPLVDFEAMLAGLAPNATTGAELFLDHVHPTIEANRDLAVRILRAMESEGWIRPDGTWSEDKIADVSREMEGVIDPAAHAVALRNLAKVHLWAGKTEDAQRMAQQALKHTPDDAQTLCLAAEAAVRLEHATDAQDLYRHALTVAPDYVPAVVGLGTLLSSQGHAEEAIALYQHALTTILEDPAAIHLNLGTVLSGAGRSVEASKHFTHALKGDPDLAAQAHNNLGNEMLARRAFEEASDHYRAALTLDPNYAQAHGNLGLALAGTAKHEEAIQQYHRALAIAPNHAPAHYNMGLAYMALDAPAKAIPYFETTTVLMPDFSGGHTMLTRAREALAKRKTPGS